MEGLLSQWDARERQWSLNWGIKVDVYVVKHVS